MKTPTIKALVPEVIKGMEEGLSFYESAHRLPLKHGAITLLKQYVMESTDLPLGERMPRQKRRAKWGDEPESLEEPVPTMFAPQRTGVKKVEIKGKTYYDVTPLIIDCGA